MAFMSKGNSPEPLAPNQIPNLSALYSNDSLRNKIINGRLQINQRGVSFVSTGGTYGADRWLLELSGLTATMGHAADNGLSGVGVNHIYLQCGAAKTTLAAVDYAAITHRVEGYNMADLKWGTPDAKPAVLSFRAATGTPGGTTIAVAFRNATGTRSYVALVNVVQGVKGEYQVVVPGCTDGTWENTNGNGLSISFTGACGSTYQATAAGQWESANRLGAPGMSNLNDTLNRFVNIADVQFEKGTVATPFECRPYQVELAMCQRFYCKSYDPATAPGSPTVDGALHGVTQATCSYFPLGARFPVPMRGTPTVTPYAVSGTSGTVTYSGVSNTIPYIQLYASSTGFAGHVNNSSIPQHSNVYMHFTASAEL